MSIETPVLSAAGLQRFKALRSDAIQSVTERIYATHGSLYAHFGEPGRDACRDDLAFHLEFLRPVLEFGIIQPMVDYLRWLASVLVTRDVPVEHLSLTLDWLGEYFASAMPGEDGEIVRKALQLTKTRFAEADSAPPAIDGLMPTAWPESEDFERALLAGDRHAAITLLDSGLEQGHSLVDVELHIIQPALYAIGKKWQNNQVSVTQEHLATAIAQMVMTYGLLKSELPAPNGKRVLLACVEGNQHAVGLQMVADAFQLAGWEVQFLGANVPTGALLKHVDEYKPDLLGLSVSFAQQLQVVKDIMERLTQAHDSERPAVIVGGLALNQFSRLAGQLGADAWSPDACAAVESAKKIDSWTRAA